MIRRKLFNLQRLAGISVWLVSLLLLPGWAWADTWQKVVSVRISTEFDSNPTLSSSYPESVRRDFFEPSYSLAGKIGVSELKAGLSLQMERSSNQALSQDLDGPNAFIDWLRQSEKDEFGINSRYVEIATRDSGIDATGVVPVTSTRASSDISGRWKRELSERALLLADGKYESVSYEGGSYMNYSTGGGSMRLSYAFSEPSRTSLKISGTKYVPENDAPFRSLANAILGLEWKISAYLEGNLQAGLSKNSGVKTRKIGAAGMQYTGQKTRLTLRADRSVIPSGQGNFVLVDQVIGEGSHDLSERSKTGIDLEWQKNKSIKDNNIRTAASVWLQHNLNLSWAVQANYLHTIIQGGMAAGASSNTFRISFIYTDSNF